MKANLKNPAERFQFPKSMGWQRKTLTDFRILLCILDSAFFAGPSSSTRILEQRFKLSLSQFT
jgi:hypothetical protein